MGDRPGDYNKALVCSKSARWSSSKNTITMCNSRPSRLCGCTEEQVVSVVSRPLSLSVFLPVLRRPSCTSLCPLGACVACSTNKQVVFGSMDVPEHLQVLIGGVRPVNMSKDAKVRRALCMVRAGVCGCKLTGSMTAMSVIHSFLWTWSYIIPSDKDSQQVQRLVQCWVQPCCRPVAHQGIFRPRDVKSHKIKNWIFYGTVRRRANSLSPKWRQDMDHPHIDSGSVLSRSWFQGASFISLLS